MEKWSRPIGGASIHRFALYDMVMLKKIIMLIAGGIRAGIDANQILSTK